MTHLTIKAYWCHFEVTERGLNYISGDGLAPVYFVFSVLCVWKSLRWRHNGRHSVSNHQPHDRLLNRLFRRRSKKTSNLRVTGLCAGNSPGTGEFPAQMASNAENVSIWRRNHGLTATSYELISDHCFLAPAELNPQPLRDVYFTNVFFKLISYGALSLPMSLVSVEWHRRSLMISQCISRSRSPLYFNW